MNRTLYAMTMLGFIFVMIYAGLLGTTGKANLIAVGAGSTLVSWLFLFCLSVVRTGKASVIDMLQLGLLGVGLMSASFVFAEPFDYLGVLALAIATGTLYCCALMTDNERGVPCAYALPAFAVYAVTLLIGAHLIGTYWHTGSKAILWIVLPIMGFGAAYYLLREGGKRRTLELSRCNG